MSIEHRFQHEAMKTTFSFRIIDDDESLAKSSVSSAIELIDKIENLLSRYIPGSDVWQLNHMQAGDSLFIDDHTYTCLRQALELHRESDGLFDISLGRQIEHLKAKEIGPAPGIEGSLKIDPDKPVVYCIEPGREIDLGGIGKGYALDCVHKEITEWGITRGLLSAGASTHLAFGESSWPIELLGSATRKTLLLHQMALSVSGADVQGEHIVAPTDVEMSAGKRSKLWVQHPRASYADAWSTACYLMNEQQLSRVKEKLTIIDS